MASMDYCVFENTTPDMRMCVRMLENYRRLNQYEAPYRHTFYELAKDYISAYERYEEHFKEIGQDPMLKL